VRADELKARLEGAGELVSWPALVPAEWSDVTADSRQVVPGSLFVAWAGSATDSHQFLPAVAGAGATASLVEHAIDGTLPQIVVRDGRRGGAIAAALHHGDPARHLELVAVTGTNGKTTSAHLLRHLFGTSAPAGSIGTLGAVDGNGDTMPGTGNLTTPGPVELQRSLAALLAGGVKTVAMEASSHSLDQDRLYGLRFRAAVFTNLTRDHLDYHQTVDAYLAAKLKLVGYLAPEGWAVTNADDRAWERMAPGPRRPRPGRSPH